MRIAVVGTGIAGLGAAHVLQRAGCDVTCFEQEAEPGGHAHTERVAQNGEVQPVDTGFIVYNEPNYPLFTRLLRELQVATQPSDMSFGCYNEVSGIMYSSRGLRGLWARPRNVVSPALYRMVADIARFNRLAGEQLRRTTEPGLLLGDFLQQQRFSQVFIDHYISPMSAAIWSAPPGATLDFPAETFFRFFNNHALLKLAPDIQWRTVCGGSRSYVQALVRPFSDRVHTRTTVRHVIREADQVRLQLAGGEDQFVDRVVLAVHADQALAILDQPSKSEQEHLAAFPYQPNRVALHNDISLLPPARRAWASWNVRLTSASQRGESPLTMTYHMNRLQGMPERYPYCVSLNPAADWCDRLHAKQQEAGPRIFFETSYAHPAYTAHSFDIQPRLATLNEHGPVYFCGAWFGYGFHEDGLRSGVAAARALGVEWN